MYLRFVPPRRNPDTGIYDGVFSAAYALRHEGDLSLREWDELDKLLHWFDLKLKRPTRFNRTRSKGYFRRATKGVCWFRYTADRHLIHMRRMAAILRDQGNHVTMIKTGRPGYVVYEDAHQVVAEPFSDLRC